MDDGQRNICQFHARVRTPAKDFIRNFSYEIAEDALDSEIICLGRWFLHIISYGRREIRLTFDHGQIKFPHSFRVYKPICHANFACTLTPGFSLAL